jgi:integrase
MSRSTGKRRFHYKNKRPTDPAVKAIGDWLPANRSFYDGFRRWLQEGGYSASALNLYGVAARLALGLLDKPYWQIDPQADLAEVERYIAARHTNEGTRLAYRKGLLKLAGYLRQRCGQPAPEKPVNWGHYLDPLPPWLADAMRAYVAHCSRGWLPENRRRATLDLLSHCTQSLRWMAAQAPPASPADLTPARWFDYLDARLAEHISPVTLNDELRVFQSFVCFLAEQGQPVCSRVARLEPLKEGPRLPRDLPLDQLRRLLREIEADAAAHHAGIRRRGVMDRAWFLLMLHGGLRTGEVRRLRLGDLELDARRVRVEQSKGLKDRIVYLSQPALEALGAYLALRGPANTEHVFLFRHVPLTVTYCLERLHTYGRRCGLDATPHQLRHSCATLLLNAGAPVLAVQALLGHKFVDTTLGYARLYDGTIAADYYRAMAQIEKQLDLQPGAELPVTPGHLLAMVDALQAGTLNDSQRETVQALRSAILDMAG